MKNYLLLFSLLASISLSGQSSKVSTIDFVQILDDNRKEAIYYYENNWLVLRKQAVEKGYIDSYEIIEVESTNDAQFHLILITTYPDRIAFGKAEERFQELIELKGPLRLLNDKQPGDFRKIIFSKPDGNHLF
ncbi:hypothetical protein [Ekhidna sp.]|uniref:hypothetical protein n=1 Tax=Ekhidna sp. TaxID=2608089 RepID=UPI003B5100E8